MDVKSRIKALFKEAELYRSQGLLAEAKEKYSLVADLIKKNKQLANRQYLLAELSKKIGAVDEQSESVSVASRTPKLPSKIQDIIKKLFSFSETSTGVAELEGAIALAKFGQFERAIMEFNKLIKNDDVRMVAAKNILRCHVALSDFDNAYHQYEQWRTSVEFASGELEKIRVFLQDIFDKKGIEKKLAPLLDATQDIQGEPFEDELLDIVSIGITLEKGPRKGKFVELDVNFQKGNTISIMVSSEDKDLIENLQVGFKLNAVEFSSPFAVFTGAGVVSGRSRIDSGPKQGDYMLDIRIQSA